MTEEERLIKKCIKGDRKSQKELYDRFSPKMYVIALRYSQAQQEAEDILQESFIKIFDHLKDFKGHARLETWMHRIVVNTALNQNRSKLYLFPMTDVETLSEKEDEELILSGYSVEELLGSIRGLPSGCKIIFNLYAIEGYNHKEIAQLLNISEGTSKSQYSRAKTLLQKQLSKERMYYG